MSQRKQDNSTGDIMSVIFGGLAVAGLTAATIATFGAAAPADAAAGAAEGAAIGAAADTTATAGAAAGAAADTAGAASLAGGTTAAATDTAAAAGVGTASDLAPTVASQTLASQAASAAPGSTLISGSTAGVTPAPELSGFDTLSASQAGQTLTGQANAAMPGSTIVQGVSKPFLTSAQISQGLKGVSAAGNVLTQSSQNGAQKAEAGVSQAAPITPPPAPMTLQSPTIAHPFEEPAFYNSIFNRNTSLLSKPLTLQEPSVPAPSVNMSDRRNKVHIQPATRSVKDFLAKLSR